MATPENEQLLLQVALHGTVTHVEKTVRLYRRAQRAEELDRANQRHRDRALHYFVDDDGTFVLRGHLAPEQGALILKALEAAEHELHQAQHASREARVADEPSDQPAEPAAARRADALALLAETFLAHGAAELSAGDRHLVTVHVDERVLRDQSSGDQHLASVHIDERFLRDRDESWRCHLRDATSLPPATVRRLCCDASLVILIESADGVPLDVGRKTRAVPPAMHRALVARDVGCRYLGCTNTRFVDAHHIVHWADGGETSLDNLTRCAAIRSYSAHPTLVEPAPVVPRDHRVEWNCPTVIDCARSPVRCTSGAHGELAERLHDIEVDPPSTAAAASVTSRLSSARTRRRSPLAGRRRRRNSPLHVGKTRSSPSLPGQSRSRRGRGWRDQEDSPLSTEPSFAPATPRDSC